MFKDFENMGREPHYLRKVTANNEMGFNLARSNK